MKISMIFNRRWNSAAVRLACSDVGHFHPLEKMFALIWTSASLGAWEPNAHQFGLTLAKLTGNLRAVTQALCRKDIVILRFLTVIALRLLLFLRFRLGSFDSLNL